MATFDSHGDFPGQIRIEGEQITLLFNQTGPNTARISWNIPPPAAGCTSETQAYCGILVTIDTQPASKSTIPEDGTPPSPYTADPTADRDLHAGNRLGTALVIGALYEGEKKGKGEALTTFLDITGLDPNQAYFVSGYAVDCSYRYHTQGVFAYSQPFGGEGTIDTHGTQSIILEAGAAPSSGTGLELGEDYNLSLTVDGIEYTVTVNGDNAQTHAELVAALNDEFEKISCSVQIPVSPGAGVYYYAGDKLYQWDGDQLLNLPVLNEPTDPTALAIGDYWYDTPNTLLYIWDGSAWNLVDDATILKYSNNPADVDNLTSDDYWYQPDVPSPAAASNAYNWCGNVWCEKTLLDQETDPSLGLTPTCGSYWYSPETMLLRSWDEKNCVWVLRDAIYWDEDPSAISTGALWFNETNETLFRWDTPISDFWNTIDFGYQDVLLDGTTAPYTLDTLALPEGTYNEIINFGFVSFDLEITVCNATEGTFRKVFEAINEKFTEGSPVLGNIGFRGDPTGLGIRITSTTQTPPDIQGGGTLFSSIVDFASIEPGEAGTVVRVSTTRPLSPSAGEYWVNPDEEVIRLRNAGNTRWNRQCGIFFPTDPTDRMSCDLWWNSDTDVLNVWDIINNTWTPVEEFKQQTTDPAGDVTLAGGVLWYQPSSEVLSEWNGSTWNVVNFVTYPTDPTVPSVGDVWFDPVANTWGEWDGAQWDTFNPVDSPVNPTSTTILTGTYWYDTMAKVLYRWNGSNWIFVMFNAAVTGPIANAVHGQYWIQNGTKVRQWNVALKEWVFIPAEGDCWFDTGGSPRNTLKKWNGSAWAPSDGIVVVTFEGGDLKFVSTTPGSRSAVVIDPGSQLFETTDPITNETILTSYDKLGCPVFGNDGLETVPSYQQIDVGTDGSSDERRKVADRIRRQLGWPTIEVELDKEQMNVALDIALEELRRRSASAYHRGFMLLNINPGQQRYNLRTKGYNPETGDGLRCGYERPDGSWTYFDSIVQVMGVFRITSAFMTSAHGSGVFGQVVLQHLYNMGTFDLLSFHLVSEYVEQLEHLFASRITFNWNEGDRVLWLHQMFSHNERALMDVAVERTEQDLLTDRYTGRWVEHYARAQSKLMLSQIRGKYSTLPGAGGGVSLNAADLQTQAESEMEELISQIDNYQVNNVEEYGMHCEFIIG